MAKKVALSFLMLAAFFGFCYGGLAILAPQNLKAWNGLNRAALFPALHAGKEFVQTIPHWCWLTLGVLSIPSIFLIWAILRIAKIDGIIKTSSSKKPARSRESWRKNWEPPEPPRLV